MDELIRHLKEDKYAQLYSAAEMSHLVGFMCGCILSAAKAEADSLSITPSQIRWYKANRLIDKFSDMKNPPVPTISYASTLHLIRERDAIVRRHTRIVRDDADEMVVEVVP
jgi:hypothetical protein